MSAEIDGNEWHRAEKEQLMCHTELVYIKNQ